MTDTLLVDIELTSAASLTGSFALVTGFTATVNIVGTGSVVVLAFEVNGAIGADSDDECGEYRFTIDASAVGSPVLSSFKDSTDEGTGRSMVWIVDGLSTGSHTFTVEGINRQGTVVIDTTRIRLFQVAELDGATTELAIDILSTSADDSPATWANVDEMSAAFAVTTGSVHFVNGTLPNLLTSTDESADIQFAIGGTRDGPSLHCSADQVDEGTGNQLTWLETGLTGTITFSQQWQSRAGTAQTDTARNRVFQVVERTSNYNLLIDIQSISGSSPPDVGAGFDTVDEMSASVSPAASSLMLTLFNMQFFRTGGGGDATIGYRISRAASQVGGEITSFGDASARTPGCSLFHFETGVSGANEWAGEWEQVKTDGDAPSTSTDHPRTLQTLELLTGAAGPAPFLPVYIRRQALNPILVR